MTTNSTYTCSFCGKLSANREWFIKHLVAEHPLTWLAQRAQRDELERLKREQKSGNAK